MNAIQISDNKTLKLTNVLSRTVSAEEMGNAMLILTQMDNFIKSHGAQPIGPLIQHIEVSGGANPTATFQFLRQASDFIPRMDPEYHMDAVLRVRKCLYAHYTGPVAKSQLASQKLSIHAFENDIELRNNVYTIYVNQDEDEAVVDVFMETV